MKYERTTGASRRKKAKDNTRYVYENKFVPKMKHGKVVIVGIPYVKEEQ